MEVFLNKVYVKRWFSQDILKQLLKSSPTYPEPVSKMEDKE